MLTANRMRKQRQEEDAKQLAQESAAVSAPHSSASAEPQQKDSLRDLADDELQARLASVRAEEEQLKREQSRLESEAATAAAAFAAEPNEKNVNARSISEQLATNARSAVKQHAAANKQLVAEEHRRKSAARLDELRGLLRLRETTAPKVAEAITLFNQFSADLERIIRSIGADMSTASRIVMEANALEAQVGNGTNHAAPSFDDAIGMLREALEQRIGRIATNDPCMARVRYDAQSRHIHADVRFPLK